MTCMLPFFHNKNTKWDNDEMLRMCGEYELSQYPQLLAERFSNLCQIGIKNNFDVIIIIQPNVELKSKLLTNQELESYFDRPQNRIFLDNYELMKNGVLLNTKECHSVNDFTSIFDNYEVPLYHDYHHVGDLGNRIISEHILDLTTPILFENGILDEIPSDLEKVPEFKFIFDGDLSNSDFSGQDLKEESFFGADLSGSNFEQAILTNADFRLANFENTNFANSVIDNIKLRQNVFDGANFENVDFTNVDLENVDLSYTNLQKSNLSNKNLERTLLYKSDLRGADLSLVKMPNAFLNEADVSSTNFAAATLSNINFSTIKNKSLENADISFAGFSYSDLRGVKLPKEMESVNFQNTKMQDVELKNRKIHSSLFLQADLRGVEFDGAYMGAIIQTYSIPNVTNDTSHADLAKKISPFPTLVIMETAPGLNNNGLEVKAIMFNNFLEANLENASLVNTNLSLANLINTNLSGANLSGANLSGANLMGSDLTGANLSGANLTGVDLSGANLTGVDLSGAKLDNTLLDNAILTDAIMP